jgi:hypothetical protein
VDFRVVRRDQAFDLIDRTRRPHGRRQPRAAIMLALEPPLRTAILNRVVDCQTPGASAGELRTVAPALMVSDRYMFVTPWTR